MGRLGSLGLPSVCRWGSLHRLGSFGCPWLVFGSIWDSLRLPWAFLELAGCSGFALNAILRAIVARASRLGTKSYLFTNINGFILDVHLSMSNCHAFISNVHLFIANTHCFIPSVCFFVSDAHFQTPLFSSMLMCSKQIRWHSDNNVQRQQCIRKRSLLRAMEKGASA